MANVGRRQNNKRYTDQKSWSKKMSGLWTRRSLWTLSAGSTFPLIYDVFIWGSFLFVFVMRRLICMVDRQIIAEKRFNKNSNLHVISRRLDWSQIWSGINLAINLRFRSHIGSDFVVRIPPAKFVDGTETCKQLMNISAQNRTCCRATNSCWHSN